MDPHITSILDSLRANTERHPDRLLYAFLNQAGRPTESYTYEAFQRRTTDIAAHIQRSHVLEPGDRVLLVYPPGLEMIGAFFACVRLGLIPVPVYPPSSHGFEAALYRMNFIAEDCEAAAVLTNRTYYWSLKLHRTRHSVTALLRKRDYTSKLAWIVTSDAQTGARGEIREAHSDILFLQYTSGSTSDPKGVMVTHENVLSSCEAVCDHTPVAVSWLPQYHDLGLIAFYLFVAIRGGTTYGFSPLDFMQRPSLWLESISRYRATASAAPNFAFEYCLRPDKVGDRDLGECDFSSLRLLWSGAEPVRTEVYRGFQERLAPYGLPVHAYSAAYGLAEYTLAASGRGSTIRAFDAARLGENEVMLAPIEEAGSGTTTLVGCGRALGETEIKIVDVTNTPREAPRGRIGEIWINGPSKCPGYWGKPGLSSQVFEAKLEGATTDATWLRTGDLGFMEQGELFVCGRSKDLIILRGLNYYPQDIEAIVEEDPAIRRGCTAAFSVEQDGGELVVVVAELRSPKRRPQIEHINRSIRKRLGIVADSFVLIPARTLPKTSSGKIVRHRARQQWRDGGFEVIEHVENARLGTEPGRNSRRGAALTNGAREPEGQTPLVTVFRRYGLTGEETETVAEIGFDSLTTAEFAMDLEHHLRARHPTDLADAVDLRWLQKIAISELFGLLQQVDDGVPRAALRFRKACTALRQEQLEVEAQLMRRDSRSGPHVSGHLARAVAADRTPGGVLLTGGTGFFGPFLLKSLLEQCDEDIYVLVRANDAEHARERLQEGIALLGADQVATMPQDWQRRVIPICGDLSRANLGVSDAHWTFLSHSVHTIYHNGAVVNYLMDYETMRPANVGGTREIIRLASSVRPKTLNHISTTFIFGWSTHDTLLESDTNANMELLDFGYSQSKWVSEQLVLRAIRHGLAARIFRPALIAPSIGGGGHTFDITIRLLAFMLKYRISTTAGNQVSFSPADLVANNIVAISMLPDTAGQTFHVTRDTYSSMLDITAILGELTDRTFESFTLEAFVPTVIERCQRDDLLFPLLNFLVRSVDNITAMEFKRYDNATYREARARSSFGMEDPPLEDVVRGIVRFLRRHDIVEKPEAEPAFERTSVR